MKANELMIGDWVQDITSVVIDAISNEDICTYRDEHGYITANPSNLKPITLTAEILEKNGFEEKTESNPFVYYLFKDGDNSVSLEHTYDTTDKEDYWACSIGNRLCDVCTISMHYIHELQHALRLCGIDKDIVL